MARLTYKQKQNMRPSTFAIPPHGDEPGHYPLPDLAHARNALARVAQFGSSQEKARVHHAVAAKFPELAKRSEAISGKRAGKANPPR